MVSPEPIKSLESLKETQEGQSFQDTGETERPSAISPEPVECQSPSGETPSELGASESSPVEVFLSDENSEDLPEEQEPVECLPIILEEELSDSSIKDIP